MSGQPLQEAKKRCAKAIVGQLTADDFVSVVAMGSDVESCVPGATGVRRYIGVREHRSY